MPLPAGLLRFYLVEGVFQSQHLSAVSGYHSVRSLGYHGLDTRGEEVLWRVL